MGTIGLSFPGRGSMKVLMYISEGYSAYNVTYSDYNSKVVANGLTLFVT